MPLDDLSAEIAPARLRGVTLHEAGPVPVVGPIKQRNDVRHASIVDRGRAGPFRGFELYCIESLSEPV